MIDTKCNRILLDRQPHKAPEGLVSGMATNMTAAKVLLVLD